MEECASKYREKVMSIYEQLRLSDLETLISVEQRVIYGVCEGRIRNIGLHNSGKSPARVRGICDASRSAFTDEEEAERGVNASIESGQARRRAWKR